MLLSSPARKDRQKRSNEPEPREPDRGLRFADTAAVCMKGMKMGVLKTIIKIIAIATGGLFIVYMLNLDQKLLSWAYARVNEIFDRKPVDIKF